MSGVQTLDSGRFYSYVLKKRGKIGKSRSIEIDPEVDVVLMEKLTLLLVHQREPLPFLFV